HDKPSKPREAVAIPSSAETRGPLDRLMFRWSYFKIHVSLVVNSSERSAKEQFRVPQKSWNQLNLAVPARCRIHDMALNTQFGHHANHHVIPVTIPRVDFPVAEERDRYWSFLELGHRELVARNDRGDLPRSGEFYSH